MSTPSHTAFTEESNMEVWISKHGRNILYGILGIALVVLVVVQLSRSQETKAHGDYLKAETAFQAFSAAQETAPRMEAFAELKEVLGRRPELLPRYEGMIAQELFAHDLGKEAAPYAQTVLKRQHLPDYYEFATTSLLIADGRYDEALRQTEVLKAKLLSETSEAACMLRNFAALRLIGLHQALNQGPEELAAIVALRTQLEQATAPEALTSESPDLRASQEFVTLFRSGKVNLLDYLRARQAQLG